MVGIAVATIVPSTDAMNIAIMQARVTMRRRATLLARSAVDTCVITECSGLARSVAYGKIKTLPAVSRRPARKC